MFIHLRRESVAVPVTGGYTIIDSDLLETVLSYKWHTTHKGYIRSNSKIQSGSRMMLHRLVAGIPLSPWTIDHINRNKIDNRRVNLRLVTKSASNYNNDLPPPKEYYWHPSKKRWIVAFSIKNRLTYFGSYPSEQEAIERARIVCAELRAKAFSVN